MSRTIYVGYEALMWTILLTLIGSCVDLIYHNKVFMLFVSVVMLGGSLLFSWMAEKQISKMPYNQWYGSGHTPFKWHMINSFVAAFAFSISHIVYNFTQFHYVNLALIPGFVCIFFTTLCELVQYLKSAKIEEVQHAS